MKECANFYSTQSFLLTKMSICSALSSVKSSIANLFNSMKMDPKQTLYDLQMERFEVFKTQNPENEHFDVVFDIHGQILYANKFTLCSVSTTFKSMLSDQWTKSGEPIKLEEYSFDDFKQLVTFIYSGECQLTNGNILSMVDIAEFYAVKSLKMYCEEYLAKMQIDFDNVYEMIGFANTYSLTHLQKVLVDFVSKDISSFLQSENFFNLPKSFVIDLLKSNQKTSKHEELFKAVFKWAELRAEKIQENDANLDVNDAIKIQMSDLLPLINSKLMSRSFFVKFVIRKQFLFTDDELKNIMFPAENEVYVHVTDGGGRIMRGYLLCHDIDKVVQVIKSQKNICCSAVEDIYFFWNTLSSKPATKSKFMKSDDVEWYLIFAGLSNFDGNLAIKHRRRLVDGNYLLAEMFAENGFILDEKCKIEVV